jgi:hypothetical protein
MRLERCRSLCPVQKHRMGMGMGVGMGGRGRGGRGRRGVGWTVRGSGDRGGGGWCGPKKGRGPTPSQPSTREPVVGASA